MIITLFLASNHNGLRLGRSATLTTTAGLPVDDEPTLVKHGYAGAAPKFDGWTRGGEYRGPNAGPQTSKASHKLSLSSVLPLISVLLRVFPSVFLVSSKPGVQTRPQSP
jgi:hypothetical protein